MNASPLSARLFHFARMAAVSTAFAGAALTAGLTFVAIGSRLMSDPSEHVALVANYGMKSKAPVAAVAAAPAPQKVRVARSDF